MFSSPAKHTEQLASGCEKILGEQLSRVSYWPCQCLSITTCSRHENMTYQATAINDDLFVQPPLPLIQQFKRLLSLHHLQSSTQPHTLYKAVLSVLQ